jgi:hypothetical protein
MNIPGRKLRRHPNKKITTILRWVMLQAWTVWLLSSMVHCDSALPAPTSGDWRHGKRLVQPPPTEHAHNVAR